jgi:hypothetical protein
MHAFIVAASAVYVVGRYDGGDRARESRAGLMRHVGVGEEHQRGLRLREVKRDRLVAENAAAVSDPAGRVEDPGARWVGYRDALQSRAGDVALGDRGLVPVRPLHRRRDRIALREIVGMRDQFDTFEFVPTPEGGTVICPGVLRAGLYSARGYPRWFSLTGGPGAMAHAAHPAAAAERTCQAPWYCHRLSGRHNGDPERPAA